jgi:NADPH:quinone reductase-like Zn-dependent oxidoreductase
MVQCINSHQIRPVVDSTFSLATINDSMQRMLHPERFGKVTIDMRN